MTDPMRDIDALIRELRECAEVGYKPWRHAALTALVAERDSLRAEIAAAYRDRASGRSVLDRVKAERDALVAEQDEYKARCKAQHEVMADMVGKQREAASDLRERLVCAALTGILANYESRNHGADDVAEWAVVQADATIAAMRKGESHGK